MLVTSQELSQAEARSLEFHLGLSPGWQAPKYQGHHVPLPRKWSLGGGPGLGPSYSGGRCGAPKQSSLLNQLLRACARFRKPGKP